MTLWCPIVFLRTSRMMQRRVSWPGSSIWEDSRGTLFGLIYCVGRVLCQRPVNMFLFSGCVICIQKMLYKFLLCFCFVRVSVCTRVPGAGYIWANTWRYCVFSHCNIIKMFYTKKAAAVLSLDSYDAAQSRSMWHFFRCHRASCLVCAAVKLNYRLEKVRVHQVVTAKKQLKQKCMKRCIFEVLLKHFENTQKNTLNKLQNQFNHTKSNVFCLFKIF